MCKDKERIEYFYDKIQDEVLKARIQKSMEFYIHKAYFHKMLYYILTCISIIIPMFVTIIHSVDTTIFVKYNLQMLCAFFAAATTCSTSLTALFSFKENWKNYRSTVEKMKTELIKFHFGIGKYTNRDEATLSLQIEKIITIGNRQHMNIIDSVNEENLINPDNRTPSNGDIRKNDQSSPINSKAPVDNTSNTATQAVNKNK